MSSAEELAGGSFESLIPDREVQDTSTIDRVVICSGKVYYDLYKARKDEGLDNVALVRLEQFYPFPDGDVWQLLSDYKHVSEIVWCQEEPKNMGGWSFVAPLITEQLEDGQMLRYAGRRPAASPATGSAKLHNAEQNDLVERALKG